MTDSSLIVSTAGYDQTTWRRYLLGLALLTCLVGTIYAFVTPAGLPYDEPSHWATVQYYVDHGRMPVLGDAGVSYEAQMGPVAYVADAVIVRIADALGLGAETAFRLVRLFGSFNLPHWSWYSGRSWREWSPSRQHHLRLLPSSR